MNGLGAINKNHVHCPFNTSTDFTLLAYHSFIHPVIWNLQKERKSEKDRRRGGGGGGAGEGDREGERGQKKEGGEELITYINILQRRLGAQYCLGSLSCSQHSTIDPIVLQKYQVLMRERERESSGYYYRLNRI